MYTTSGMETMPHIIHQCCQTVCDSIATLMVEYYSHNFGEASLLTAKWLMC